jgi:hypothetical protein
MSITHSWKKKEHAERGHCYGFNLNGIINNGRID